MTVISGSVTSIFICTGSSKRRKPTLSVRTTPVFQTWYFTSTQPNLKGRAVDQRSGSAQWISGSTPPGDPPPLRHWPRYHPGSYTASQKRRHLRSALPRRAKGTRGQRRSCSRVTQGAAPSQPPPAFSPRAAVQGRLVQTQEVAHLLTAV